MTVQQIVDSIKELGALATALTAIGGLVWLVVGRPFVAFLDRKFDTLTKAIEAGTAATEAVRHELQEHINDKTAHPGKGWL